MAEIVEVSVESEDEGLWLDMAGADTPGFEGTLTSAGSDSYRVRAYATGRDRAYELIDKFSDEVPESFKFDIWSAPVAGPATLS